MRNVESKSIENRFFSLFTGDTVVRKGKKPFLIGNKNWSSLDQQTGSIPTAVTKLKLLSSLPDSESNRWSKIRQNFHGLLTLMILRFLFLRAALIN